MAKLEGFGMKLKIKLQKEGRGYVAICEDFSLNAQAPTMREAIKHIEEAFYFAIQFPDFVEVKSSAFA